MRITLHPEHESVYLYNAAANRDCQEAVAAWQAEGKPILAPDYDLRWTPDSARHFVEELAQLFQAYNRVLWEQFHYCPGCGGQCCVVDASDVRAFDLIAVALLGEAAPQLGEHVETTPHGCIYLSGHHCTWPDAWRTIKCWSFFCLGSGPWDASSSLHELHAEVTHALQAVMKTHLPQPLRRYEEVHELSLAALLDDPVRFAHAMHEALTAIFVAPLHSHYPLFTLAPKAERVSAMPSIRETNGATAIPLLDGDVMEFIAEAMAANMEKLEEGENAHEDSVPPEQFLADLEMLEWILMGRPAQGETLLSDMLERYGGAPGPQSVRGSTLAGRMAHHLRTLLHGEWG